MAEMTQYTCLDCRKPYCVDHGPDTFVLRPTCPACRPSADPDEPIRMRIVESTTIVPNWRTDSRERLISTNRALREAGGQEDG